jgi:Tol biopolymer transport system component
MNADHDDLGRTLRALLLEEAETMDINTASASERLERELRPAPRRRRIVITSLVAAAAAVLAAILVWSGREDTRSSTPVDAPDTTAPTGAAAAAPPPYFLDLTTLDQEPAPGEDRLGQFLLTFSPDGTQAAFGDCGGTWRCSKNDEAFFGNADGTGLERVEVGDGLNAYPMSWTPDGRLVIVVRHGGTRDVGDLFLYDPGTGDSTRITNLDLETADYYAMSAFVSVDGSTVFYSLARAEYAGGPVDGWSVPVSGGESTLLFRNFGEGRDVVDDLADGRIAFRRPPVDVMAAIPGEDPQVLIDSAGGGFAVSPDGTRIAYLDGVSNPDLYILDVATGETGDPLASDVAPFFWVGNDQLMIQPAG